MRLVGVLAWTTLWLMVGSIAWAEQPESDGDRRLQKLEEEIARIKVEQARNEKRIAELLAEIEQIKNGQRNKEQAPPPPPTIRPRFDVLLRFEDNRFEDPIDLLTDDAEGILLTRIRLFLDGRIAPGLEGGLQISTGLDPNPTSPFIRLGDSFRGRSFVLARAYLTYRPFRRFQGFGFSLGRMPNPFWRGDMVGNHNSEMLWDDDVNLEGLALQTPIPIPTKHWKFHNTLGYFVINNPVQNRFLGINADTILWANQFTVEAYRAKVGIAYYDYQGLNSGLRVQSFVPGQSMDVLPPADPFLMRPGLQVTNNQQTFTVGHPGFVRGRFSLLNITGQYNFPQWEKETQLYFLVDWVKNFRVRRDRIGYALMFGGRSTNQEAVGSFNTWLTYRSVDADATLATFADSDLGMGTDYRGWEIGGYVRIQPNTTLQISFFRFLAHPFKRNSRQRLFIDLIRSF